MDAAAAGQQEAQLSLAAVRDALVREEDSVVFALIKRARHPHNEPAYAPAAGGGRRTVSRLVLRQGWGGSRQDAKLRLYGLYAHRAPARLVPS